VVAVGASVAGTVVALGVDVAGRGVAVDVEVGGTVVAVGVDVAGTGVSVDVAVVGIDVADGVDVAGTDVAVGVALNRWWPGAKDTGALRIAAAATNPRPSIANNVVPAAMFACPDVTTSRGLLCQVPR
jgi:hypothetical protein